MNYESYLASLGIELGSEQEDKLLDWAFDLTVEDMDEPFSEEELEEGDEMSDEEVIDLIKLCIESDPNWKEKVFN